MFQVSVTDLIVLLMIATLIQIHCYGRYVILIFEMSLGLYSRIWTKGVLRVAK